jgi:hypothetical protein
MFDLDALVAGCRDALTDPEPRRAVREILLGTLRRTAGADVLFSSAELTVLNVVWAPRMSIYPHDHRMWPSSASTAGRRTTRCSAGGQTASPGRAAGR